MPLAWPMSKRPQNCRWELHDAWPQAAEFARTVGIDALVAQVLYNRGISEADEARRFLNPTLNDLIDPAALLNIDAAVARIQRALADNQRIVIYGDYDVDGIVGTAILWHCLRLAGREVDFYVPHRIDEGYGLNREAIEELAARGFDLVITVDCGITAFEPAARAAELGLDLIITDHHQPEDRLPPACAVIHPNLPGQDYPNPYLCGAGVAFKLAWAIAQAFSGAKKVSPEFREFLVAATGLAALGTVADVVPLVGENRTLASFGLQGLAASNDRGISALIAAAGLTGAKLDATDIGFKLAPRLNAAGRMGHARLAVELFTKSSERQAHEIARYLEAQNTQRQKVEKALTAEAFDQIKTLGMDNDDYRGLVLMGENWHGGVVGIVASRIVDRYHRPTVVLSQQQDKVTGSCRSIPGFNVTDALAACAEHLRGFGGHAMAAGVTLDADKVEAFRAAFNAYAAVNLTPEDMMPVLRVDAETPFEAITKSLVEQLSKLKPFGAGNPTVRLLARNLRLNAPPQRMGKRGDHLSFLVAPADDLSAHLRPGGFMRVVAFSKARWEKKLIAAETIDLVFEPTINRFNGNTTVELLADDFRPHEPD